MNYFGIFFTFFVIPMMIVLAASAAAYMDKLDGEEF